MRLPSISGIIKRRLLVNYRAEPEVVARLLPEGMRPKVVDGFAIGGICLIRLEGMKPKKMGFMPGLSSENAAHRFAVFVQKDGEEEEAVYVPRRDTDSVLSHLAGGRLFPGEQHLADFVVRDGEGEIDFTMNSRDGEVAIRVEATETETFPSSSRFSDLEAASRFFETGSRGYSDSKREGCYDCMDLAVHEWSVSPLEVNAVSSSYFDAPDRFPSGSIEFDHALLMREIQHDWHSGETLGLDR